MYLNNDDSKLIILNHYFLNSNFFHFGFNMGDIDARFHVLNSNRSSDIIRLKYLFTQ